MDLLVLGSNGLLGSNVAARAATGDGTVVAAYHSDPPELDLRTTRLDVTEESRFEAVLDDHDPEAVVNCAALTDVDECERDPERARTINGEAPGRLAELAAERGIGFVQVSTDYVFDGEASSPYDETAETNPVQTYGESKLRGERTVRSAHPEALVPRLSFSYGRRGDTRTLEGFPSWVRRRLEANEELPLFADQHVTPSRAGEAAETILALLGTDAAGAVHVGCRSCVTPYSFGVAVAEILGYDTECLSKSTSDTVDRDAPRPAYTCLETTRVTSTLGRERPTLREDLRAIL